MTDKKCKVQFSSDISPFDDSIQSIEQIPNKILIATTRKLFDYGVELTITERQIRQMKDNFDQGVLGRKIPILFDHPLGPTTRTSNAAGWIGNLEVGTYKDGPALFCADIEWTPEGQKAIYEKSYRYTSIGAWIDFVSPKDGQTKYGMTLYEVSLTNDPADVNLGEIRQMNKKFANLVKIGDDESKEEHFMDEIEKLKKELSALSEKSEKRDLEFSELFAKFKKAEENTEQLKKENAELSRELKQKSREAELDKMILEKRITPAVKEKALELSSDQYEGFKIGLPAEGTAYSSEPSGKGGPEPGEDDGELDFDAVQRKIVELAKKRSNEKEISFKSAISEVLDENGDLKKIYYRGERA